MFRFLDVVDPGQPRKPVPVVVNNMDPKIVTIIVISIVVVIIAAVLVTVLLRKKDKK